MKNRNSRLSYPFKYLKSLSAYRREAGPRPVSAALAVTNRCNLRCEYCNTPFLSYEDEMNLEQVKVVIRNLKSSGVVRLGLTGGEPLLRKDIDDIIKFGKSLGMFVTVNSNLLLYSKNRHKLDEADLLFTSIDGVESDHKKHRGINSYKGLLQALELVKEDNKKLVAICVVSDENVNSAMKVLDLAEEYSFSVHFQARCFDTAIVRGQPSKAFSNSQAALSEFWRNLSVEKKKKRPVASSRIYLENMAVWPDYRKTSTFEPGKRCAAGYGFLYVDPAGLAWPCAYTKSKTAAIDLKKANWSETFSGKTPCNSCIVGPHLEFSLLYNEPLRAAYNAASNYF